jgi:hypothetical protein
MKQSLLKTLTITISLYIYSFTFEAFSYNYQGITISLIFNGNIAVLGGGTHEWLIWLANPLCFTAILCLIFDKKKCNLLCVSFHNTFPLSFLSSNTILVAESGTRGEILSIKSDTIYGYQVL